MKFKSLHAKAKRLDELIDQQIKVKETSFLSLRELRRVVKLVFPDTVVVAFGLHKLVFYLRHKSHELALKVGKAQAVERDLRAYKQLPPDLRHAYFAKVFWHTKYCLLQEYGVEAEVSPRQLVQLRSIVGKYGLLDITCDNIRSVNGNLKIIDAGISPPGLFRLWKTADYIARRLPSPVSRVIRKSRLMTTVKQR